MVAFGADSGVFFFLDVALGSFVRFRFCAFSLAEPRELSQDFALLPVVRVSNASSFLGIDFLRGTGVLVGAVLRVKV